MTAIQFSRDKIVYRSGVQLLALQDDTDRGPVSNTDQIFGTLGRFERGAIDRAFLVDSSTRTRTLGGASSTLASALNEAHIQLFEALDSGAYQACVSRLVPAAAKNQFMTFAIGADKAATWAVADELAAGYMLAIKHLECFNDGVKIGIHAVEKRSDLGVAMPTTNVSIRLIDVKTGEQLFDDFEGSLLVDAKDESGMSAYLPAVASSFTDMVEITVGATTAIASDAAFYGLDTDGSEKWVYATLNYFAEGGTTYANADYDAAIQRLYDTDIGYGYLHAGGTQNTALLSKMSAFSFTANKPFPFDVPGNLSVDGAVAFMANLNLDSHYPVAYWTPVTADDPLNGGKAYIGASGVQIGMRCARNATTDANDVAPKHRPVAGSQFPLSRTGARQTRKLSPQDLDKLAKAKINPVCYETYASGSKLVFRDSLTCAKTTGDKKLASVAEMSAAVDDAVTAYSKEVLQGGIGEAVDKITKFIEKGFEALQTAGWFVPSVELRGAAYTATIIPNSRFPKEKIDVRYKISYQGCARIITVGQTLSK